MFVAYLEALLSWFCSHNFIVYISVIHWKRGQAYTQLMGRRLLIEPLFIFMARVTVSHNSRGHWAAHLIMYSRFDTSCSRSNLVMLYNCTRTTALWGGRQQQGWHLAYLLFWRSQILSPTTTLCLPFPETWAHPFPLLSFPNLTSPVPYWEWQAGTCQACTWIMHVCLRDQRVLISMGQETRGWHIGLKRRAAGVAAAGTVRQGRGSLRPGPPGCLSNGDYPAHLVRLHHNRGCIFIWFWWIWVTRLKSTKCHPCRMRLDAVWERIFWVMWVYTMRLVIYTLTRRLCLSHRS